MIIRVGAHTLMTSRQKCFRVNYALRGVLVPAGTHKISFVYRPWSVMGGLLISLLTAVGLGVYCRLGWHKLQ